MKYFAEIDINNIVLRVLERPDEQEYRGSDYLANDLNLGGNWVQTYTNCINGWFAAPGLVYNLELKIFIRAKPYPSWIYNSVSYDWTPPTPYPADCKYYDWNEGTLSWVLHV